MIRINQLKMKPGHSTDELLLKLTQVLKLPVEAIEAYTIVKKSIDARKKPLVFCTYSIDVRIAQEERLLKRLHNPNITKANKINYQFKATGEKKLNHRPVVVGSGPAGLFCGYMLAKHGYCPVIIERGEEADKRQATVEHFWKDGVLNTDSNVQFGEGGAGTFSDGKLNTLVKDSLGLSRCVVETFVRHGAPEEILYINKPHLGTDVLTKLVCSMRAEIENWGGTYLFSSTVTDIGIASEGITHVVINEKQILETETAVFAIGHSARDTFELLDRSGIHMEPKAFAVGLRIEHPQETINEGQYGSNYTELPQADYKLTANLQNGRSVYSFCMCPGGYIVNASSQEGRLAVNGMSYQARDSKNANSALIVTVTPADFGSDKVLAGVDFQQRLEEAAYRIGGGNIPVQLLGDYKKGAVSDGFKEYETCMKGNYTFADLNQIFTKEINESLVEAIGKFGYTIKGFDRDDAILSGVESRTSSPVRICRDENYESNMKGLYPCGEGAGYAGGIMSAAMDGIRMAEKIAGQYASWRI